MIYPVAKLRLSLLKGIKKCPFEKDGQTETKKVSMKKRLPFLNKKYLIPVHQFGFLEKLLNKKTV